MVSHINSRDPLRHHRGTVDCLSMFVIAMGAWCFVCQKPNRLRAADAQSGSGTHGRYHSDRGTGEKKTMLAYPHIQRSTYAHVVVICLVILDLYDSLSHILMSCLFCVEEPYYYLRASKVSPKFIGKVSLHATKRNKVLWAYSLKCPVSPKRWHTGRELGE